MRRSLTLSAPLIGVLPLLTITALGAPAQAAPAPAANAPVTEMAVSDVTSMLANRFADETPKLKKTKTWEDGTNYATYERTYKGLKVVGGNYAVATKLGPKGSAFGTQVGEPIARKDISASTSPKIGAAQAAQKGQSSAAREEGTRPATAQTKSNDLVIYMDRDGKGKLAYDVYTEAENEKTGTDRIHTYIDAQTGAVLSRHNLVQADSGWGYHNGTVNFSTVPSNGSFILRDGFGNATRDMKHQDVYNANFYKDGDEIYRNANGDDVWGTGTLYSGDQQAVDTQFGLETTYAFFKNILGRQGEADDGQGTAARVHAGVKKSDGSINACWSNATWDGYHINIGDGAGCSKPFSELDIIAHELTHGVTYYSADLQYELESGGLNEAMSDIFGMMTERYANTTGRVKADPWDYMIGEKLNYYNNGTALRYMDRPSRDGISYDCWSPKFAQRDQYGNEMVDVHFSSGPMNHAFYLLAEGSGAKSINGVNYNSPTCNGSAFGGIGPDSAAKIVYGALTSPSLPSTATYSQFRDEMVRAAIARFGTNSQQCIVTEYAMNGINVAPVSAASPKCGPREATMKPSFPRDVSGDGLADIILVRSDGQLVEMNGQGGGSFAPPVVKSTGDYRVMDYLTQTGPWDVSGFGDMMAVKNTDQLLLKSGRSETGNWDRATQLGFGGWTAFIQVLGPGDMNSDGLSDIMTVDRDGNLWFYRHLPDGSVAGMERVGTGGWNNFRQVSPAGDLNGDGKPDLVALDRWGNMWCYQGLGNKYVSGMSLCGNGGWGVFTNVTGIGDVNGDGRHDLIALDSYGNLKLYPNRGNGDFGGPTILRTGLTGWRLVS